jgi:enoyl-CoA hydratase
MSMPHTSNSPAGQILPDLDTVSLERDGHILLIGLNRPQKRNSFDRQMLADLSRAYALLEADTSVRAGVLFGHGDHFTAGLDLADVGPGIASGEIPSRMRVGTRGGWTSPGPRRWSGSRTAGA